MKRKVYIASNCDPRLSEWLKSEGYITVPVGTSGIVSAPVSNHPDMFMCKLGAYDESPVIFCDQVFSDECGSLQGYMSCAESEPAADYKMTTLLPEYPHDIAFNAACTGRYFIHNLKYTAHELRSAAARLGMIMVDVRQGYTKCSTVIVDENSVITYDQGIVKACTSAGMDVLTVQPGHVLLPGYDTGFIGGTSGRIGDTIVFNGNLAAHPDAGRIVEFINSRGLSVKWFEEWPLTDTGSIITRPL